MDLTQLRYFAKVAETLHFGRAAALLHISQPPLSKQIQNLEQELGVQLLDRSSRRVSLTPAGHALASHARKLLASAEQTRSIVKHAALGDEGELRIGYEEVAAYRLLPSLLAAFRRRYPAVRVSLEKLETHEQLTRLRGEMLDVALVGLPVQAGGVETLVVRASPLAVALRKDHALASRKVIRLEDLRAQRVVMYSRAARPDLMDILEPSLRSRALELDVVESTSDKLGLLTMVAAGYGLSIVPLFFEDIGFRSVTFRALGEPRISLSLGLAWRTDGALATVTNLVHLARRTDEPKSLTARPTLSPRA